jgi:hypothetical protein
MTKELSLYYWSWKTGSTRYVDKLRTETGALVIKELLHEDRFESKLPPGTLQDPWSSLRSKSSAYPHKYLLDSAQLCASTEVRSLADSIGKFFEDGDGSVICQIPESPQLCIALADHLKMGGITCSVFGMTQSPVMQALSVHHNYLEGNAYFYANFLLFFLFNYNNERLTPHRRVLNRLSNTGAIQYCEILVSFMPSQCAIAATSYYQKRTVSAGYSLPKVGDEICPENDISSSIYDRYAFMRNGYARDVDSWTPEALSHWLANTFSSRSTLSMLHVEKRMILHLCNGEEVTQALPLDRCILRNISITAAGHVVANNDADPMAISSDIRVQGVVSALIAHCQYEFQVRCLNIDGRPIPLVEDRDFFRNSPDSQQPLQQHSKAFRVDATCMQDVYIEVNGSHLPEFHIISSPLETLAS